MKINSIASFFFLFVVAALLTGCSLGGNSGGGTGIQQGQPTVQAPQAGGGSDYFTEDFSGNLNNWKQFLTNGDASQMTLTIKDSRLVFDLEGNTIWAYTYYAPKTYDDVRIDVSTENRGQNDNNISLICRYDENEGWYEFNIANSGLYKILYAKWDSDKRHASYSVVADGGSNKIHVGKEVNDFTAICKGRTLTLMINGSQVKSLDENTRALRSGNVGLGVSSFSHVPVNVEIISVKVSQP